MVEFIIYFSAAIFVIYLAVSSTNDLKEYRKQYSKPKNK